MSVVQVAFDLPPEIQKGLAEGALELGGLVVRNAAKGANKGQIVKHLNPIGQQAAKGAKKVAVKAVDAAKNNPKLAIGIGIAGAIAGGGAAVYNEVKKRNNRKKYEELPWQVRNFNSSLSEYMNAVKAGKMSDYYLDELIKALDNIDESPRKKDLWKQIDSKKMYVVISAMRDYTEQLSKANNVDVEAELKNTDNNVIDIRAILNAQKKIFNQAA